MTGLVCLFVRSLPLFAQCGDVSKNNDLRAAIDHQYAVIEHATFVKDAKELYSVYSSDFEAVNIDGSVWKLKDSAAYTTSGFDQVRENIHLNNTIVAMMSCKPGEVKATVLQQWTRIQQSFGKLRHYETNTVQDETWFHETGADNGGAWKRLRVDNIRPGAWLIDGKRVNPHQPYDSDAPEYDPRN